MSDCKHEWVEKYNRGHYSWHCQRCMRCLDIAGMLHSLITAERELAEARSALMTDTLPMPAEDYPIARRLREERDHYRGLVDASDTTRREWEVRAATSYADGRKAGLREAAEVCGVFYEHMWGHSIRERAPHAPTLAQDSVKTVHSRILALAPPAAEPRDEGES